MTTVPGIAAKVRVATAASAIAAAATLAPTAVAYASPLETAPSALEDFVLPDPVSTCEDNKYSTDDCFDVFGEQFYFTIPSTFILDSANPDSPPTVWLSSNQSNPDFQKSDFGIEFPNPTGLNFEYCVFGAGAYASSYNNNIFIGVGLGC